MTMGRSDRWSRERVDELKALYADETLSLEMIQAETPVFPRGISLES